ncbi:MAG: hypothetical protein ACXW3K_06975 [Brevundimonas sp.]
MPMYQLNYLSRPGAAEIVDAEDPDEAEDLARRRLLFSEPGFAIAILFEGVELNRVTQRSKVPASRAPSSKRAVQSPGRDPQPWAGSPFPEYVS